MNTENAALVALCNHLGADIESASELSYGHYGLPVWEVDGAEYALAASDEDAQAAAEANIEEMVWAFNAEFICGQCNLPHEIAPAIRAWQEKECEGANDALKSMVETHCPGGLHGSNSFSEDAIRADGRGHFLSGYDGEEIELDGNAYAYRIN